MKPRKPILRKTALRAGKPPKRGPAPKRKTRVKQTNPVRKAKRFKANFGDKAAWIRGLPCAILGKVTGQWVFGVDGEPRRVLIVAAHAKSRGAGGTARDLLPLDDALHREAHRGIRSFESKYGYSLRELADHYETLWQSRGNAPVPLKKRISAPPGEHPA